MKRNLYYSILTALLLAFSFPPFRTGFFSYFAFLPFFLLLQNKKGREALRWGYITGLFIAITTLYWIGSVTIAGMIGALLVWPLYVSLYAIGHTFLLRRLQGAAYLALPFWWVAIEYIQSLTDLAFPWNYLGYTQTFYLPFIQFAEYTSVYGISFWVYVLNVLLWLIWQQKSWNRRRWAFVSIAAILFIAPLLHGLYIMQRKRPIQHELCVSLLQGNIDPFEKWAVGQTEKNIISYEDLTRQVASEHPDLIIWPETAVPFYLRSEKQYLRRLHQLTDSLQTPILTGTIDYEFIDSEDYNYYNAAVLITPGTSSLQWYWKMRLVPFSERVPYRDFFLFRIIKNMLVDMALGIGDYTLGKMSTIFTFIPRAELAANPKENRPTEIRFAVPICFESAFPDINRGFVAKGAQMLVVITNDAWFGKTSGPHQHARLAVFRAIENRVPIVRCANTGISCFIDAFGRTYQSTHWYEKVKSTAKVICYSGQTFYTRYGNVFAYACVIIVFLTFFMALFFKPQDVIANVFSK